MKPRLRALSLLAGLALLTTLPAAAGWSFLGSPIRPVSFLQLDPSRPELLYARVVSFSNETYLWRSTDAGATWRDVEPGIERPVSALAIDPTNPEVIWAWTADGQLWRSGDAGDTWERRTLLIGPPEVRELLVDPQHPETLYRVDAVDSFSISVAVTRDGGVSFEQSSRIPASPSRQEVFVRPGGAVRGELVAFAPDGLLVSTNGGDSWTLRGNFRGTGFRGRRPAPSAPDTLYGVSAAPGSCLVRSDDGGARWRALAYPPIPPGRSTCVDVAVDPHDARHLWVDAAVAGRGAPSSSRIAESHDGGATWSAASPLPGDGLTAAGGEVLYTGGEVLYTGGEASPNLEVSRDGGRSWRRIDQGIGAGDLRAGLVAQRLLRPGGGRRLFALDTPFGDVPDAVYRSDGGQSWLRLSLQHPLALADGGAPAVVAIDARGLVRSPDGNDDFQLVPSAPPQPTALRSDVTQPRSLALIAFEPGSPVGDAPFWLSDDGGATWRRSSTGLPISCSHIASVDTCPDFPAYAVDPFDPNRRWVAFTSPAPGNFALFVSTDAGASWQVADLLPDGVLALAADPAVPGRLLIGTYGGLIESRDGGQSWISLGDLPDLAIVHQFARDGATWYAATLIGGIFRSQDGGTHWTRLEGAPDHDAPTIAIDPRRPAALLTAFRGQGVWRWTP